MTEKLYYEDAYRKEFDAHVIRCVPRGDAFAVVLDRSAFFPEGGGQSGDRGVLVMTDREGCAQEGTAPVQVMDAQEDGEDILLICSAPVEEGASVHGKLDWQYRFDRMQNHSGEHIVSGLIHSRFGYNNVGFHMSSDRMTIDLDGEITEEELRQIEEAANAVVWDDREIRTDVYTEEEAGHIEFRSKKELHGQIRVVTIEGADVCACCGTHTARTGEIGTIRILSHERFRGGVRVEMMCGRWAYLYMSRIFLQNHEVSTLLSSRMHETAAAVKKLMDDDAQLKTRLIGMQYQMIDRQAEELKGCGPVLIFAEDLTPVLVQKLTARVMEQAEGPVFSFSGNDSEGYKYAAGMEGGDLKELIREMNAQLAGRGGGKPFFLQGSLSASGEEIGSFLSGRFADLKVVRF